VDAIGNVFIGGSTTSVTPPATAGGAQPTAQGGGDAFVARFTRPSETFRRRIRFKPDQAFA
jgi:hypothetical protein